MSVIPFCGDTWPECWQMSKPHQISQSSLTFLQPPCTPDFCFAKPKLLSRISGQEEQALSAETNYFPIKSYLAAIMLWPVPLLPRLPKQSMPWNDQQHEVGVQDVLEWGTQGWLHWPPQSPWGLNSITEAAMASAGLANHHQHKIILITTTTAMFKNRL